MKNLVLFDIDGCLLEPGPGRYNAFLRQDWIAYHAAHVEDTPIPAGLSVYRSLCANPGLKCVFLTDRSERNRHYTQAQLTSLGFEGIPLWMRDRNRKREPDDGGPSKLITLQENGFRPDDVLIVFEDRQDIVDMWRSLGVTCYQTKVANYLI